MLDVYTFGTVKRISPEAPVPVLRVSHDRQQPGGAGNTVLNLVSLGMRVIPVGRVGCDAGGNAFRELISRESVTTRWIVTDSEFQTPTKNRMIADNQQIVRIDYETPTPLSKEIEEQVVKELPLILKDVSVIAISDYAKGFLTPKFLKKIIQHAKETNIPVIVDPKGIDFKRYNGASVLKPNFSEAVAAARLSCDATLEAIGHQILQDVDIESLVITRSQEGITWFERSGKKKDISCCELEVRDVTGAGDTVLAVMTAARANGIDMENTLMLANLAAGLAIQRVGCARISLADLAERLIKIEV